MAPLTTPAVLLRGHDYGDSSKVLRFYTEGHGLVSVMGRGVRGRGGKGSATLSSFASGELTVYLKANRDLHTMKDFACTKLRSGLGADVLRFAGAAAAAELVLSHAEQEPHPGLFAALEQALDALESSGQDEVAGTTLAALWSVVDAFGFAPQLEPCVRCGESIGPEAMGRFDFAAGGLRCERCGQDAAGPRVGPRAREQLNVLLEGSVPPGMTHLRQHLGLLSDFVAYHVASKPLKSLTFLGGLLPADRVEVDA